MESALKKIGDNKLELKVVLDKKDLGPYLERAEELLTRTLEVDGFRKGKIPKDLAREKVDNQKVREVALDLAVKKSLNQSITENDLDVLNMSDFKVDENDFEKLSYTISLITFPKVEIPKLNLIKVSKREVKVTEEDLTEALESIKVSRAVTKDKEGPIENGDKAEIDFEVTKNGLVIEGGVSRNHPLVIGSNHFMPGFEEQLIGLKKDETKKFSLIAPDNYFKKDLSGQKLDFTVKILNIQSIVKPDLTDDFVKSLGRFNGLIDLKKSISDGLFMEKKNKEQQRLRVDILTKIMEKTEVKLPDQMIEDRLDEMINSFDMDLHQKGLELALYLAHINKTQDNLRKDWRKEAEKQIIFSLIIHKIAKENSISVTEEEIDILTNQKAQMLILNNQADKENIDIEEIKKISINEIINEKTLNYLEKTCAG